MKRYLLLSLLCLFAVANVCGEEVVGVTAETGEIEYVGATGTAGMNMAQYKQQFPLHRAVRNNDIAEVKRLIDLGADLNKKDVVGYAPLHWAIVSNFLPIAHTLIDAHADVNVQTDHAKNTPLHCAVFLADKDPIIEHLIRAGARVELQNCDGHMASDVEEMLLSRKEAVIAKLKEELIVDSSTVSTPKKTFSEYSIMQWLNDHPAFAGTVLVLFCIVAGIMLHNCLVLPEENNAPMPLIHRVPVHYPARAFMDSSNSDYIIIRNSVEW